MPPGKRRLLSKTALTLRQREALAFIRRSIRQRGYSPTIREIGDFMEIQSPNGVLGHLHALQRKGYIYRGAHRSRAICVINKNEKKGTRGKNTRVPAS